MVDGRHRVSPSFDEFEKLIRELMGTPFWPITVYMLSLAYMSVILYGTLWGTREIVDTTTRILAWRRSRREERQVIRDKGEKKRFWSWRKGIPVNLPKARVYKKPKVSGEVESSKVQQKDAWKDAGRTRG